MNTSKPLHLYVPEMIETIIRDNVKRNVNNYLFLVSYVIEKQLYSRRQFVSINRQYVKNILGKDARIYLEKLTELTVFVKEKVVLDKFFVYNYAVNTGLVDKINTVSISGNDEIHKAFTKEKYKIVNHLNRQPKHLLLMRERFMNLQFDYAGAKNWISQNCCFETKKIYLSYSIEQLNDKNKRYFKRSKTNNRLNTNLTNLKSNLRNFIFGDFVYFDLKNSQPFFLYLLVCMYLPVSIQPTIYTFMSQIKNFGLFKKRIKPMYSDISKFRQNWQISQNGEILKFKNWVLDGKFYDNFSEFIGEKLSRKEIKEMMFLILFSNNNSERKKKEIFIEIFPTVNKIIEKIKSTDYTELAVILQKIESYVFIDVISKRLCDLGIVPLTIHDCIIVDRKHEEQAFSVITDTFSELFTQVPTFHTEDAII